MKKYLALILFVLLVSAGCAAKVSAPPAPYATPLQVGNQNIFVQVVTTPTDMEQGLSGRNKLSDTQGMLFDFGAGANTMPNFWMKDMKFDLDLVWIKNNKIVGITPNIPAPKNAADSLPTYAPPSPVDEVLEVNAGWTNKNNVAIGDEVKAEK